MSKKFENLTLGYANARCDVMKEADISRINCALRGSRAGQYITFESYGKITFDENDISHWHPTIEYLENFNRRQCNCAIYEIYNGDRKYTHAILYQNGARYNSSYGMIWFNEESNEVVMHKIQISFDLMDVLSHINQVIISLNSHCPMKIG